jgi:hypothetical protein
MMEYWNTPPLNLRGGRVGLRTTRYNGMRYAIFS